VSAPDPAARKAAARKAAVERRAAVQDVAASRRACAHLVEHLRPLRGRAMAGYMPIRTEIDPIEAMTELARHGPVGVPVIAAPRRPLEFHRWEPGVEMVAGPYGARIPKTADPVVPQVVILPLLAFDDRGYRLGYGGGFYDRTLARLRAAGPVHAVGLAFAGQRMDGLPTEPTDEPMDALVTERGVVQFGP